MSAGEEYEVGEHVLEDLESCSEEEAGFCFSFFFFLCEKFSEMKCLLFVCV